MSEQKMSASPLLKVDDIHVYYGSDRKSVV